MNNYTTIIAIIILLIVILIAYLSKIRASNKINNDNTSEEAEPNEKTKLYPYKKKMLLTPAEYSFYKILKPECDKRNFLLCPKVRIEDFVEITTKENVSKYRGYIKSRHIDFLLCDNALHIIAGIELDDNSHKNYKSQIETDNFKNKLFETINIRLFRIEMSKGYYKSQIENMLNEISDTI